MLHVSVLTQRRPPVECRLLKHAPQALLFPFLWHASVTTISQ